MENSFDAWAILDDYDVVKAALIELEIRQAAFCLAAYRSNHAIYNIDGWVSYR